MITDEEQELFLLNSIKPTENGCWDWQRAKSRAGYGAMRFRGGTWKSHRVSWTLFYGEIPDGLFVCHHCDNPACVRPSHLFLGTALDNTLDKMAKGRQPRGESHGQSKLTWQQVLEIRKEWEELRTEKMKLAKKHGVSPRTIRDIVTKQHWKI